MIYSLETKFVLYHNFNSKNKRGMIKIYPSFAYIEDVLNKGFQVAQGVVACACCIIYIGAKRRPRRKRGEHELNEMIMLEGKEIEIPSICLCDNICEIHMKLKLQKQ